MTPVQVRPDPALAGIHEGDAYGDALMPPPGAPEITDSDIEKIGTVSAPGSPSQCSHAGTDASISLGLGGATLGAPDPGACAVGPVISAACFGVGGIRGGD